MNLPDLICPSHLRWDFVFQRPQHLLTRWARHGRVYYVEEPIDDDGPHPHLEVRRRDDGLRVLIPHLPSLMCPVLRTAAIRNLMEDLIEEESIVAPVIWYYTPMALPWAQHLPAAAVVYDCMDQLSAFLGAPPELIQLEEQLIRRADVVTTGGYSLYREKRRIRDDVHVFPSSVDAQHFHAARTCMDEPADQKNIPHPRLGFFGVIDERFDVDLLAAIAQLRPEWQFVMLGPVVKIDPATLPVGANLHYLGGKTYDELPGYVAGWEVALLPFACNQSTRFISPTKTPEYLAAGRRVVSTPIADVVEPYGRLGLVAIADTPCAFVEAAEAALKADIIAHRQRSDSFLRRNSWDSTWHAMVALVMDAIARNAKKYADRSARTEASRERLAGSSDER